MQVEVEVEDSQVHKREDFQVHKRDDSQVHKRVPCLSEMARARDCLTLKLYLC